MKAVILCDGEIPDLHCIDTAARKADLLIAADGGAYTAQKLTAKTDVIIGDLDSYTPTGTETASIIKDPDQETNDLEKALAYAAGHSINNVAVFGATGKRLDHTLKNLSVLLQFENRFSTIVFRDRYSTIEVIRSPFRRKFPIGTSISLFPLSGTVEQITTTGLEYPLSNGTLQNGVQDGSSNITVDDFVEIDFKKGDLLLIINHKTD